MSTRAHHRDDCITDRQRKRFRPHTVRAYAADLRILAAQLTGPRDEMTLQEMEAIRSDAADRNGTAGPTDTPVERELRAVP
jgi:hypothetical protein